MRCQWGTIITNPTEGALTQLGYLCRLLRILDVCNGHRFAERLLKSSYDQLLNSHDSEATHIAKYGYSLTCPSKKRYTMYINVHLQPMQCRLVARRQVCWLDINGYNDPCQTAYRPKHSTETALVRIHEDLAGSGFTAWRGVAWRGVPLVLFRI